MDNKDTRPTDGSDDRCVTIVRELRDSRIELPEPDDINCEALIDEIKKYRRRLDVSERMLEEVKERKEKGKGFKLFLSGLTGMMKEEVLI